MEMIHTGKFPKNTLFCGDAGFVGFPLWSDILQSGGHFLVRVGANVSLLREGADYELAKNGLVLCWPQAMQAQTASPAVAIGQGSDRQNRRLLADERLGFQRTHHQADGHILQNAVGN